MDEKTKETLDLYDNIISACMVNTFSFSKDGRIILRDFNKNIEMYMFEFEIAKMLKTIHNDKEIYLDMGLFEYLMFKLKYGRKCKFKRIKHKDTDNCELNIEGMLLYVAEAHGYNVENFSELYKDIYNLYWNRKEK